MLAFTANLYYQGLHTELKILKLVSWRFNVCWLILVFECWRRSATIYFGQGQDVPQGFRKLAVTKGYRLIDSRSVLTVGPKLGKNSERQQMNVRRQVMHRD